MQKVDGFLAFPHQVFEILDEVLVNPYELLRKVDEVLGKVGGGFQNPDQLSRIPDGGFPFLDAELGFSSEVLRFVHGELAVLGMILPGLVGRTA